MAFPTKKPAAAGSKGPKGPNTPIKEYPGQEPAAGSSKGSAPAAPAASKSTNAAGPQAATSEPKLSPEAEAARAKQGAVTITSATGPAVAPPPDPRASYQVGEAEDNTPLISFTALASAANKKGSAAAVLPAAEANSDLQGTAAEDSATEDDAPAEDEEEVPAAKKPPFGKK